MEFGNNTIKVLSSNLILKEKESADEVFEIFLQENDDDDDGNTGVDNEDTTMTSTDIPDMAYLKINQLTPSEAIDPDSTIKLTQVNAGNAGAGSIRLFKTTDMTTPFWTSGTTDRDMISEVSLDQEYYVEGVSPGEIILKLEYTGNGITWFDKVKIYVVDVNYSKVFDPKLQDATADIKYTLNALSSITPKMEVTIMDGVNPVACLVRKTEDVPLINAEIVKQWSGKWGLDKDGNETTHKDKYADPKKYTLEVKIYKSADDSEAIFNKEYDMYVVRLGVTEIKFAGVGTDEWFPLQYHISKDSDDADGIASVSEHYAVPQTTGYLKDLVWRIGDETSNEANLDITDTPDKGEARSEITPHAETFYPPQDVGTVGAVENDSFNYPICYKLDSRIKILVRTGNHAFSQVNDAVIQSSALGYNSLMDNNINMYIKWGTKSLEPETADAHKAINPDEEIVFVSKSTDKLGTKVGKDTITLEYTWKYKDGGVEKDIPGKFTSSHTAYIIVGKPQSPWDVTKPWIASLDYAVSWAAADDADSIDKCAVAVTKKINSDLNLEYDKVGGAPNYGTKSFGILRMANFLLYLKSNAPVTGKLISHDAILWHPNSPPNNSKEVINCSDCGTLTKSFANILGSDLKLARINQQHRCNKIKPIGASNPWAVPFSGYFGYHAFATSGATGSEEIYDACLEVGRPDPTIPGLPSTGKLPTGMTFDKANAASYGSVTFTKAAGSTANGTISIVNVDENSTINDSITVECTAINPVGTTFTATSASGRSGTGTEIIGLVAGSYKEIQMMRNGNNTIKVKIIQGANTFIIGDKFTFNTTFNYDEYRGSLGEPDSYNSTSPEGRSVTVITLPNCTFTLE